jgi:hypothetical protein
MRPRVLKHPPGKKRGTHMPDESQVLGGIDYRTTFPFTLIFKSFRIAIHPSKLILALLALILICCGGWVLDALWPAGSLAVPNEMTIYEQSRLTPDSAHTFSAMRDATRRNLLAEYHNRLVAANHPDGKLSDIKWAIIDHRDHEKRRADEEYDPAKQTNADDKRRAIRDHDETVAQIFADASSDWQNIRAVQGVGLFQTFFDYELGAAQRVVSDVVSGRWIGAGGALDETVDFIAAGPQWGLRYHTLYFLIFGIYFLIIWAIFGGAIARIAAVQVARDEKISFRQALSFSTAKFLSFVSAPIIPLLIIVFVGLVVAIGGAVFNIPALGPIVVGAFFFLALAAGFVMTLVLLGLVGGYNLMYPTIAVEGSDSFDAISRSFSYLYARPWRLLFYSLVALIYGALCYAFVRFFIRIMLALTHYFVSTFIVFHADNAAPLLSAMWPDPLTAQHLTYNVDYLTLSTAQEIGGFLMWLWVNLTIAMLGAFAISFYFSANTIIYSLMRREVDATELDDVYVEQTEEDFSEASAPATEIPSAPVIPPTVPPIEEPPTTSV